MTPDPDPAAANAEYERKLAAAMAELFATGMWSSDRNPPLFRAQRALGLRPVPPLYQRFWAQFWRNALWFGVPWGITMWFVSWRPGGFAVSHAVVATLVSSVLFAAIMGAFYARRRRKYRLSRWDEL